MFLRNLIFPQIRVQIYKKLAVVRYCWLELGEQADQNG